MQNKKAFSIVEIIITIAIVTLLAVIGLSSKNSYENNMYNTKTISDVETINNALHSYFENVSELPMPMGNTNFYSKDKTYVHSYDDSTTFGVYGSVTEETLPKAYLNITPIDPRTNSYYSYGKTKHSNEYEIASIQVIEDEPIAKVVGDYDAEESTNNQKGLIREYNGPNFVIDGSKSNLPYNPEELVFTAKFGEYTGSVTVNNNILSGDDIKNYTLIKGDLIENNSQELDIYFSDGSKSTLEANSSIKLSNIEYTGKDNLNTFVKIALGAGKIWTKATSLNDDSSFEVYTSDTTAAVRGTVFGVGRNLNQTELVVVQGEIHAYETIFDITEGQALASVFDLEPQKIDYNDQDNYVAISNTLDNYAYIPQPPLSATDKDAGITKPDAGSTVSTQEAKVFTFSRQDNEPLEYSSGTIEVSEINNNEINEYIENFNTNEEVNTEEKDDSELDNQSYNEIEIEDIVYDDETDDTTVTDTCSTFYIPGENGEECAEADSTLQSEGYSLVAYAPYNQYKDLHLYGSGNNYPYNEYGKIYNDKVSNWGIFGSDNPIQDYYYTSAEQTSHSEQGMDAFSFTSMIGENEEYQNLNSWVRKDGEAGVAIGGDGAYLEYDELDLGDNWAIEMSVHRDALTSEGMKFIFDTNNNRGLIVIYNTNKYIVKYGEINDESYICNDFSTSSVPKCNFVFNNNFITISYINDNNPKIKFGNNQNLDQNYIFSESLNTYTTENISSIIPDSIYLGSNKNMNNQINGLINYSKIYKKINTN